MRFKSSDLVEKYLSEKKLLDLQCENFRLIQQIYKFTKLLEIKNMLFFFCVDDFQKSLDILYNIGMIGRLNNTKTSVFFHQLYIAFLENSNQSGEFLTLSYYRYLIQMDSIDLDLFKLADFDFFTPLNFDLLRTVYYEVESPYILPSYINELRVEVRAELLNNMDSFLIDINKEIKYCSGLQRRLQIRNYLSNLSCGLVDPRIDDLIEIRNQVCDSYDAIIQ